MKSMMTAFIILGFSFSTLASEAKVCERLLAEAEAMCDEAMCEESASENGECYRDGDFYEGRGICVYDNTLPELIADYNKKNPRKKVSCKDI